MGSRTWGARFNDHCPPIQSPPRIQLVATGSTRSSLPTLCVFSGLVASFFSLKMVRLLIICGPIASILTGVALGTIFDLCVSQVTDFLWFLAFGSSEEKKDALEDEASSTEPKSPEVFERDGQVGIGVE